ncbi:MAG: C4-dicarboxylate TRAP transporter substrate-binding protein [Desulfobacterales bacterium]
MKCVKKALLLAAVLCLLIPLAATAKTVKMTVVAGHPPVFLWVSLCRDFFIPEVDKRIKDAGIDLQIEWNQAYGGTIAKIGGELKALEDGVGDMGFVGSLFEAPKMPLHNVSYMTPFTTSDIFKVVDTIAELQNKVPELGKEWTKHKTVYLGGAALDTYGILSNFEIKKVEDVAGHKLAAPGPSANWLKNTGGVAVASNLNEYYNGIQTGVFEGAVTFMTAAASIKLHEVAPYLCMVDFGAQFAGGIAINKEVFSSLPPAVQKIFLEVGQEYSRKLAQAQADRAQQSIEMMKQGGAKVTMLSDIERKRWADKLPNVPMEWAAAMGEKGIPGKAMLQGYLDGLRQRGVKLARDWDK